VFFFEPLMTVSALTLLIGCQEEQSACKNLSDEVLAPDANELLMVQLMPLPPHHLLLC